MFVCFSNFYLALPPTGVQESKQESSAIKPKIKTCLEHLKTSKTPEHISEDIGSQLSKVCRNGFSQPPNAWVSGNVFKLLLNVNEGDRCPPTERAVHQFSNMYFTLKS